MKRALRRDMLELQFDESPLCDELVVGCPKRIGGSSPLPEGHGLGIRLAPDALAACTERPARIIDTP